MQKQIIPISTATENKPIKTFRKVVKTISLPTNLFLQTQFLWSKY